jgi:hypothetical protein
MSKEEIKQEISRELDSFSENALQDLLSFLKKLHTREKLSLLSGDRLKTLLADDKELLQRLAQ